LIKRTEQWSVSATAASVEAAEWLARVRSGRFDEVAFREWITADATHSAAFAKVLEAWEIVGGLKSLYPEFADENAKTVMRENGDARRDPPAEIEDSDDDEKTMVSGGGDGGSGKPASPCPE